MDSSYFSTALMNSCVKVVSEQMVALDRPVDILTRGMRETLWLNSKTYGEFVCYVLLCLAGSQYVLYATLCSLTML